MGLLHLQDVIETIRAQNPQSVLLDGGDLLQGSPLAHYFNYVTQGGVNRNPFFKLINKLKYDAIVIGNHDLGVPRSLLQKYVKHSNFTWLGANVEYKGLEQLAPYKILQRRGLKIAILGITTPGVQMWISPQKLDSIRIQAVKPALEKWIKYIKRVEQPDLLIGLFHVGFNPFRDEENSKINRLPQANGLRQALTEGSIDLVITGHDHWLFPSKTKGSPKYFKNIPVIGAGHWGKALIKLNLIVTKGKITRILTEVIKAAQTKTINKRYKKMVAGDYLEYLFEKLPWSLQSKKKVALNRCLNQLLAVSNLEPDDQGSLFPAIKVKTIRGDYKKQLNRSHLFRWIKYDNRAVTILLNRKEISLLQYPESTYGYRKVTYNQLLFPYLRTEFAEFSQSWWLSKKNFTQIYAIKISDYHFNGGGGILKKIFYLPERGAVSSKYFLRDRLFKFLKRKSTLPPQCNILQTIP